MSELKRTVYVIATSAPPVLHLDDLLVLLTGRGWDSYVILSPTAATWVDVHHLAEVSRHPVRVEPRRPQDPDPLPPADAIIAAPLTFNSLNKWAAGISDTLALGLLNEVLGLSLQVVAAPCVKNTLRRHPAYDASVKTLIAVGVKVLDPVRTVRQPSSGVTSFDWTVVLPD
jgi:phosphopantothenoylcysteine decarboxylase